MKLASLLVLLATAFASAQNQSSSNMDAAIRAVLQAQVDAWNHHDLDAFMAGYWKSPDLTFFSGATETKGWQPTLERYQRNYQSAGHSMGTLSFSDLRVEPLSADCCFRSRPVPSGDARRQTAARRLHPHLPQVSRGLAHRPRP